MLEGLVLRAVSGAYSVHVGAREQIRIVECVLRGNLKKTLTYATSGSLPQRVTRARRPRTTDTVAVGDRVRVARTDRDAGIIVEVLPRATRFTRASFKGREQTLVTNLDQLIVVFACAEPNPDLWLLDRWLVAAELHGLSALIVANKSDLVTKSEVDAKFGEYSSLGYPVIATSARLGTGVPVLAKRLEGRISAFTGPSGAGKSSLLNAIQPGLRLDTGSVGRTTFKGRHVTTARELIPLRSGGWVADTPGLRRLNLLDLDRDTLAQCFVELQPVLAEPCRFSDCMHDTEPDCAVKAAVSDGRVSARRYESFLQIAQECP